MGLRIRIDWFSVVMLAALAVLIVSVAWIITP